MATLLFFNDRNLYLRDGFTREYGEVTPLYDCAYNDGYVYAAALPQVFQKDGKYYMIYGGLDSKSGNQRWHCFLMAESEDGLHFKPCTNAAALAGLENAAISHEFMERVSGEIGDLIVDETCPPQEKYKLLICSYEGNEERIIDDYVLTSGDGHKFTRIPGSVWNKTGTEPGVGAFYNPYKKVFVIAMRPDGGNRKICLTETADFINYTEPRLVLEQDGEDEPLSELYGMPVIHYEGYFIGLLQKYRTNPKRERKFQTGVLYPELAFSRTGDAFMRCLRRPFIKPGQPGSADAGMIFATDFYLDANGCPTIIAACCKHEHGHFFSTEDCYIMPYHLRKDGFVCMRAQSEGLLCTNTLLFEGESLSINLKAESATCAIYERTGLNEFALIEGFDHSDCEPFSGDSTAWTPNFRRSLAELKDKIILVEVKVKNAEIYAIRGDFIPMQYLDCVRWDNSRKKPVLIGMN